MSLCCSHLRALITNLPSFCCLCSILVAVTMAMSAIVLSLVAVEITVSLFAWRILCTTTQTVLCRSMVSRLVESSCKGLPHMHL